MIGFVVYVHHTHPRIAWHDDRAAWSACPALRLDHGAPGVPLAIGALVHHIMEHTAHHVDMSVPLYRLRAAQAGWRNGCPGAS